MKEIKPCKMNDHLLGEVIAMKIKKELKQKENSMQDLIDKVEKIKYR